jgi:hypothetical protein
MSLSTVVFLSMRGSVPRKRSMHSSEISEHELTSVVVQRWHPSHRVEGYRDAGLLPCEQIVPVCTVTSCDACVRTPEPHTSVLEASVGHMLTMRN